MSLLLCPFLSRNPPPPGKNPKLVLMGIGAQQHLEGDSPPFLYWGASEDDGSSLWKSTDRRRSCLETGAVRNARFILMSLGWFRLFLDLPVSVNGKRNCEQMHNKSRESSPPPHVLLSSPNGSCCACSAWLQSRDKQHLSLVEQYIYARVTIQRNHLSSQTESSVVDWEGSASFLHFPCSSTLPSPGFPLCLIRRRIPLLLGTGCH